jgi:DNA-binding transcriptional LysR family regulator
LTEAGEVFLEHAQRTLRTAEQAVEAARSAAAGMAGRLAIGMVSSATYEDLIATIVLHYRARCPNIELVLQELTTPQQIKLLHAREIQIGFIRPPIQDPAIALETVRREPLLVALPMAHPLAARKRVPISALATESWVTFPSDRGLGFSNLVLSLCREAGFTPKVSQVATHFHTMIGLVAAGLGVTLVPTSVTSLRCTGVVYCKLANQTLLVETSVAYLQASQSPMLNNFLNSVRAVTQKTRGK